MNHEEPQGFAPAMARITALFTVAGFATAVAIVIPTWGAFFDIHPENIFTAAGQIVAALLFQSVVAIAIVPASIALAAAGAIYATRVCATRREAIAASTIGAFFGHLMFTFALAITFGAILKATNTTGFLIAYEALLLSAPGPAIAGGLGAWILSARAKHAATDADPTATTEPEGDAAIHDYEYERPLTARERHDAPPGALEPLAIAPPEKE